MPSDFLVLQYLPYVLPLALPAFWLLRCLVSVLLGRQANGGCKLCFTLAGLGFTFWPEAAPFFGIDGPWRTYGLPDDIGLRLLIAGFFLLAVGLLLYFIPWLVHRFDRGDGRPADPGTVGIWAVPGADNDALDDLLDALEGIGLDGGDARDSGD